MSDSHHGSAVDKSAATVCDIDENLWIIFPVPIKSKTQRIKEVLGIHNKVAYVY